MTRSIFLLMLGAAAASAQTSLTPQEILDRVRAAYTGVRQFELAGKLEGTPDIDMPFRYVYQYPDKLRLEGTMGGNVGKPGDVIVADGQATWNYDAENNTYTHEPGPFDIDMDLDDDELPHFGIDPSSPKAVQFAEYSLAPYRMLAGLARGAKLSRVETVQLAGVPVECYVIEAHESKSTDMVWIDTRQFYVLRMESTGDKETMRLNFQTVRLNQRLPDDAFSFVPPAGAKQIKPER